eukprot:jgi/Botrbrau1/7033/Bobra.0165s0056.1
MCFLGGTVVSALTGKWSSQVFHLAGLLHTTSMQFFLSCATLAITSLRHSLGGNTHSRGVPSVGSSKLQGMTSASAPIPSAAGYLVKYLFTWWNLSTVPAKQSPVGKPHMPPSGRPVLHICVYIPLSSAKSLASSHLDSRSATWISGVSLGTHWALTSTPTSTAGQPPGFQECLLVPTGPSLPHLPQLQPQTSALAL